MRSFFLTALFILGSIMLHAQWIHTGFQFAGSSTEISSIIIPAGIAGDSTLYASAYGEGVGIYKTTNNGKMWADADTGLGSSAVNQLIDCANGSGGYDMFAATYGDGVYRSTNAGKEWKSVSTGLGNTYVNVLLAVPNGSKTYLFAGTDAPTSPSSKVARLYVSTDLGASWMGDTAGIHAPYANAFALAYAPAGSSGTDIFMGTYLGGIFRSTNFGQSWQAVDSGLTNIDVRSLFVYGDSTGVQHIFAGTWGGGIYISTDFGNHWVQSDSGMSDSIVIAFAAGGYASSQKKIFAGTAYYGLEFSTDFGASWATSDSGLTDSTVVSFAASDSFLYAGTGADGVWKIAYSEILAPVIPPPPEYTLSGSVIAGWNLISVPYRLDSYIAASVFPGATSQAFRFQNGYAASETLANGAGYWLHFDTAQAVSVTGFPLDPETLAVAAGWNLIGSESGIVPVSSIGASDTGMLASQFYSYSPGGYAIADSLLPWGGYWLKTNEAGQLYLAAATGKASFKHRLRISPIDELPPAPPPYLASAKDVPKVFRLDQNYPNPFNPATEIRYELARSAFVSIQVYDILGREAATLVNAVQPAGDHEIAFDASQLSSGVYMYRIKAGPFEAARKMLLIK